MKWALCFFQSHDNGKTFTNFHSRYFLSKEAIDAELPNITKHLTPSTYYAIYEQHTWERAGDLPHFKKEE